MKRSVWLLTTGSSFDGGEWQVFSIHATQDGAKLAKAAYETEEHRRADGSIYHYEANEIEEWPLED